MTMERRRDPTPAADVGDAVNDAGASGGCCCCCWCGCCRDHEMRENWREVDLHGLRRMLPRNVTNRKSHAIRRTFWVVVMLISLVAFVYGVTDCLFVYLSQPQFTDLTADRLPYRSLPAVTLCNLNPLRLTELARRKWPTEARDVPSSGHVDTSAWNGINVSSFDVFNSAGHRLEKLVIRCSAGSNFPCSKSNFTEILTDKGLCYTIVTSASTLYLALNVEAFEFTGFGQEGVGIRVLFHDAEELPVLTSVYSGLMLAPGYHATIKVHQSDVTVISTTESPCSDLPLSGMRCLLSCLEEKLEQKCSCRPFWSVVKDSRHRVCSMKQHVSCIMLKFSELSKRFSDRCPCDMPCLSREFIWDYTFSQLLPGLSSVDRGRRYHADVIPEARLAEIADDRCVAANAAARTSREILRRDNDEITELSSSLSDVSERIVALQDQFLKVGRDLNATLTAIRHRLRFHVSVGLGGLRKSFVSGFADRFDLVRERSLTPLVDGHYETVSQLERTVKQLTFTSTTETVARKVLYFMTDNQLSGKLETAIQALDNVTKVYYSFLNAEPASTPGPITPEGRYDLHLLPYNLMSKNQNSLKTYYTGISENVAGLIENILSLKSVLKDVYQSNTVNETLFNLSRKTFVQRTLQIKHFTSLFHQEIVLKSLDQLDIRVNELKELNRTLNLESQSIASNIASQTNLLVSSFTEAYNNVLAFSKLAQQFLRDVDVLKSSLTNQNTDVFIQSSALAALTDALNTLRGQTVDLRRHWRALEEGVRTIWKRFLQDDLLSNFYLNLYNDVTEMVNNPQRSEQFRLMFFHASMLGLAKPPTPLRPSDVTLTDLYKLLNADVPVTNFDTKMTQVTEEFRGYLEQTDVEGVVEWTRVERLSRAFNDLRNNLAELQTQCQISQDLIRENVIVTEIVLSEDSGRRTERPFAYSLTSLLANVGGLLSLCLGASVMTCVEVFDLAGQSLCRSLGNRKSRKFADTSNHVLFRPVDILDDGVAAGLRPPHIVKVPLPATIPKVKIDATYRGKHLHHQAETDI